VAARPLRSDVETAARRTLLNVVATTVAAADDAALDAIVRASQRCGASGTVPIPGRTDFLDPLRAATAIGLAAHRDDYDDTHLATVIHPGAAALAAAWTVAVPARLTFGGMLRAFAVGCEVQLRLGLAMSPWHYDRGWHITGTCAPVGAAVTAALLSSGEQPVLRRAIGLAADMPLGNREGFGSMVKPFHPGKGASNGILAAALAERGLGATSDDVLGAAGGFYAVLSPRRDLDALLDGWGDRWELLNNTFKPYPCGIVCHPAIDAAVALAQRLSGRLTDVATIEVRCHPLVAELTGNPDPLSGLQARFSTIHGVAAGLADGVAGLAQYTDDRVAAPDVTRLREKVRLAVEPKRPRHSAAVLVTLTDGTILAEDVGHARGSLARPLSDAELADKATPLLERLLPDRSKDVIRTVMTLPLDGAVNDLQALLQPSEVPARTGAVA